jgi:hypothetical protein
MAVPGETDKGLPIAAREYGKTRVADGRGAATMAVVPRVRPSALGIAIKMT